MILLVQGLIVNASKGGTQRTAREGGKSLWEKRLASERTSGSFAVFMAPSSDNEEELQNIFKKDWLMLCGGRHFTALLRGSPVVLVRVLAVPSYPHFPAPYPFG